MKITLSPTNSLVWVTDEITARVWTGHADDKAETPCRAVILNLYADFPDQTLLLRSLLEAGRPGGDESRLLAHAVEDPAVS